MAYENPGAEYDALLQLEDVFLGNVHDEAVREAYLAARRGERAGWKALTEIAAPAWKGDVKASPQQVKADRALQLLYWFKQSVQ